MPAPLPWRQTEDGLDLMVRVTPHAGRDRIEGIETRDDGQAVLRLRVAAPPERGKANRSVLALIAAAFGLAPSRLALRSGESARVKLVHLSGPPAELAARAENLFQTHR